MLSEYGLNRKDEILSRVGNIQQLASFQRSQLVDGKGKGNDIINVRNGSGLQFQIYVDRGFDIGFCDYLGIPISWVSPNGPVSPYYYDKDGKEWERSFSGGLLTTCGLTYFGKPNEDKGEKLGLHGRISSTPAEVIQTEGYWEGDEYFLVFRGTIRESTALQENIKLERTITTKYGSNRLWITDKVTNESFQPVEHMVMYHFNFGYPLVSETISIDLPEADRGWIFGTGEVKDWGAFESPSLSSTPTVMLHELSSSLDRNVQVSLKNMVNINGSNNQLTVKLHIDREACPYLTQWKHQGSGKYVLGIEPGNTTTEGRNVLRKRGTLPFLQAQETKEYTFAIDFNLEVKQQ